ncbi:MAG TPA: glycosyl hydrolase 108 family protein [Candidatus Sulfotelmatobacter sp.]|nr:glycosyl hydrolase 108 family protein [Candidatus Sulfotelmatobacter sp.]
MTAIFDPAFTKTVGLEGGYTDDPSDPGGPTNWGITVAEAREFGYMGDIKDLPIETAKLIYKAKYWNVLLLDSVADQSVAAEIFDSAVNCGPSTVAGWIQEALNALSKADGTDVPLWPVLDVDKNFGPVSLEVLNTCISVSPRFVQVLIETLNCLQGAYYVHSTEKNPRLRKFFFGWIANRVTL